MSRLNKLLSETTAELVKFSETRTMGMTLPQEHQIRGILLVHSLACLERAATVTATDRECKRQYRQMYATVKASLEFVSAQSMPDGFVAERIAYVTQRLEDYHLIAFFDEVNGETADIAKALREQFAQMIGFPI